MTEHLQPKSVGRMTFRFNASFLMKDGNERIDTVTITTEYENPYLDVLWSKIVEHESMVTAALFMDGELVQEATGKQYSTYMAGNTRNYA